jgi:hypothetical protein
VEALSQIQHKHTNTNRPKFETSPVYTTAFKNTPGLSYRLAWIEAEVAEAAHDVSGEAAAVYVGQQQQQGCAGLFPGRTAEVSDC